MLKSRKHVFWEALIVTIFVFLVGFLVGIYIEQSNFNKLNDYSTLSEVSLMDGIALVELSKENFSCEILREKNIEFADKVFEEAKLLEEYEESGKLTESIKILHKKYDMLRTLAWISNSNAIDKCQNYDLIVYLYEYNPEGVNKKAAQSVWSRKLLDYKNENPNSVLLPISANQEITSLKILIEKYGVEKIPSVIINNERVIYEYDDLIIPSSDKN